MTKALILAGGGARGAFQAGAVQYLWEKDWKPDLICGVSVGALNAVALGSGITPEKLVSIWKKQRHSQIFRFDFLKFMSPFLSDKSYSSLVSPDPLKNLIREKISFDSLQKGDPEVIITAVNLKTSQIAYFSHRIITEEHLLASAAMPLMCSWRNIDGEPYWDGGIMDNVPVLPALKFGAGEIVVVLLSPVNAFLQSPPKSMKDAAELVFEQSLIGAFSTLAADRNWPESSNSGAFYSPGPGSLKSIGEAKLATVSPRRMLGFKSLWDFSEEQSDRLIREGYQAAKTQLSEFF